MVIKYVKTWLLKRNISSWGNENLDGYVLLVPFRGFVNYKHLKKIHYLNMISDIVILKKISKITIIPIKVTNTNTEFVY